MQFGWPAGQRFALKRSERPQATSPLVMAKTQINNRKD
jgi:hypothetical protein